MSLVRTIEDLIPMVSHHKVRAVYCCITNRKCFVPSSRSNKPTPSTITKVCKVHCPYSMMYCRLERKATDSEEDF